MESNTNSKGWTNRLLSILLALVMLAGMIPLSMTTVFAAAGNYSVVVYAMPPGGGFTDEEILYSADTVEVIEGTGYLYDLSATTLTVTDGGPVGIPTQLTLHLDFGLDTGEVATIMPEDRIYLDFINTAIMDDPIDLRNATLDSFAFSLIDMGIPEGIPQTMIGMESGGSYTITSFGFNIVIDGAIPLLENATAIVKIVHEPEPPAQFVSLGHWEDEITFAPSTGANLSTSALSVTSGGTVGQPASLLLTVKGSEDFNAAVGDTVTLTAAGLDFTTATLAAGSGMSITNKGDGTLTLAFDSAASVTASSGVMVTVQNVIPTRETVSPSATLTSGVDDPVSKGFPALTFTRPDIDFAMTVSESTWTAQSDGSLQESVTVTVKAMSGGAVVSNVNCIIRFVLSGTPYVTLNQESVCQREMTNGVARLEVASLGTYGHVTGANYVLRAQSTTVIDGQYKTIEENITLTVAARKISGHVTLTTGEAYDGAVVMLSKPAVIGSSIIIPAMSMTFIADQNGYYEFNLPAPQQNDFSSYTVSVERNDERRIFSNNTSGPLANTTNANTTVDIVCDNYVTIKANVYEHKAIPDGTFTENRATAELLDARSPIQQSYRLDAPGRMNELKISANTGAIFLGDNTWAVSCGKMSELSDNGASPVVFRARTYRNSTLGQEIFDTLEYDPAITDYTLSFDSVPNGFVEIYNPDVVNDGGNGLNMLAFVLEENPGYNPGQPNGTGNYKYLSCSGPIRLQPGQRQVYGSYSQPCNVLVIIADERYSPWLSGFNKAIGEWIAADGTVSIPTLDPDEYKVVTGTVGLGKKTRFDINPAPFDLARHKNEMLDNPNARILSIKGDVVTVAFSFHVPEDDMDFSNMLIEATGGLWGRNRWGESLSPGGGQLSNFYLLRPDGSKYLCAIAYNSPDGTSQLSVHLRAPLNDDSIGVFSKGETVLIVGEFEILDLENVDLARTMNFYWQQPGSGALFPVASVSFNTGWTLSMDVDTYTDKQTVAVTGKTRPEADVDIYVNDEIAATVTANKAGTYSANVKLFGDDAEDGDRIEIYAKCESRVTMPKMVMYVRNLPVITALADMNNRALIHSAPRGGVIGSSNKHMTWTPPMAAGPGSVGGGGGGSEAPTTLYYHVWQAVAGELFPFILNQNQFKEQTGWQWGELGACLLRYDPGHEMEYRVMTNNDEAISKVWVNLYNGTGGGDLVIPAIYDEAKGYWVAKADFPILDFWPLNIGVEYTLKIGAELETLEQEWADGWSFPALMNPETRRGLIQNELEKITYPGWVYEDEPEDVAANIWDKMVQAAPELATATFTDNGNGTVTVNVDGETITGSIVFLDDEGFINEMLSSPNAWQIGTDGAYAATAEIKYTQNGQPKTMGYADFLWMISDFSDIEQAKSQLGIADEITVEYTEAFRMPTGYEDAEPLVAAIKAADVPIRAAASGDNGVGGVRTVFTWALSGINSFGADYFTKSTIGKYANAFGQILGVVDIYESYQKVSDFDRLFKQVRDTRTRLHSLMYTECFEMMSSAEQQEYWDLIDEYNKAFDRFNNFQFHNRLIGTGKIAFDLCNIIGNMATFGQASATTTTAAKIMTSGGIGMDAGAWAFESNGYEKMFEDVENMMNKLQSFETLYTKRLYLKCREKYNRYETMVRMNRMNIVFDPSGFAYENGDINQRVNGVTAEIWQADDATGANARLWTEATDYDQINPQITDEDGWYSWDTPQGWWQVRLTKEGYHEARSEWLQVLPVQLGVNLEMKAINTGGGTNPGGTNPGGSTNTTAPDDNDVGTTVIGSNTIATPKDQNLFSNPDGSFTLPGGSTITLPNGVMITVPAGTVISADGKTVTIPEDSGGSTIELPSGHTFSTRDDIDIILDDDIPLGYYISADNPFGDIKANDWFFESVMRAYNHGLMAGTSANPMTFSPNTTITRGMIVTILYRMAGSPDVSGFDNPFSDVEGETWYSDAVKWAAANGIVNGIGNGNYAPNMPISRQDLAVILARYAGFMEIALPSARDYRSFNDDADISNYAKEAIERFFKAGIIGGYPDGGVKPKATATRAEVATMMMRFIEAAK